MDTPDASKLTEDGTWKIPTDASYDGEGRMGADAAFDDDVVLLELLPILRSGPRSISLMVRCSFTANRNLVDEILPPSLLELLPPSSPLLIGLLIDL